jgi:DNA-binding SARP family transcriptional activator
MPQNNYRLGLLGGFALSCDSEPIDLPVGTQRLIALLALRGRLSRSRLAGTLWPETSEYRALASLRTVIWRVNQAAARLIDPSGAAVELGRSVDIDIRRLVCAAPGAMSSTTSTSVDDILLSLTDDGELLPDWEDDWLLTDRERLRQLRLHLLEAVAERLVDDGRYGLALEAALTALRADDRRESAHRTVIRIHLAEGNVFEARRAFELCRLVLERDVGVEPSVITAGLLAQHERGALIPRPAAYSS